MAQRMASAVWAGLRSGSGRRPCGGKWRRRYSDLLHPSRVRPVTPPGVAMPAGPLHRFHQGEMGALVPRIHLQASRGGADDLHFGPSCPGHAGGHSAASRGCHSALRLDRGHRETDRRGDASDDCRCRRGDRGGRLATRSGLDLQPRSVRVVLDPPEMSPRPRRSRLPSRRGARGTPQPHGQLRDRRSARARLGLAEQLVGGIRSRSSK
jgi:hypothetical protein